MEVQTIQIRPQIRFVGKPGGCEDCDEETRLEDALQRYIVEDRVSLSQTSLSLAGCASCQGRNKSVPLGLKNIGC